MIQYLYEYSQFLRKQEHDTFLEFNEQMMACLQGILLNRISFHNFKIPIEYNRLERKTKNGIFYFFSFILPHITVQTEHALPNIEDGFIYQYGEVVIIYSLMRIEPTTIVLTAICSISLCLNGLNMKLVGFFIALHCIPHIADGTQ